MNNKVAREMAETIKKTRQFNTIFTVDISKDKRDDQIFRRGINEGISGALGLIDKKLENIKNKIYDEEDYPKIEMEWYEHKKKSIIKNK